MERQLIFTDCLTRYSFPVEKLSTLKNDARFPNLLKNIHDQYATPRLISMVARKLVAGSFTKGESDLDSNLCEDLDNLILDEIKFCEEEGSLGKKGVGGVPNVKWSDVGGLHAIKEDLVKILQWPIKVFIGFIVDKLWIYSENIPHFICYQYKKFFTNSPIKLPSGILLYGYPGTGKTLLGLAIPSLVNTKFIHIKVSVQCFLRIAYFLLITKYNIFLSLYSGS